MTRPVAGLWLKAIKEKTYLFSLKLDYFVCGFGLYFDRKVYLKTYMCCMFGNWNTQTTCAY